jgi:putative DNA primase/helicase
MKLATASFRSDATSNGGPHPSNSPSNGITSLPGLPVILDPRAPFDIARSFLYRFYRLGSLPTLFSQSGDFYKWSGRHYPEVEESTIRVQLYEYLDEALRPTEDGTRPFKPTKQRIDQVLDALRAAANLDRQQIAPVWLGDVPAPANEILPCRNGLLHLPTGRLFSHTPEFFCHNVLDFDYDADAPLPIQWLEFLNELWPGDDEAISTLQEIFGLCLTGDTRYQKMFLLWSAPQRQGDNRAGSDGTGWPRKCGWPEPFEPC